jgi:predicted dienelactone hydrolase
VGTPSVAQQPAARYEVPRGVFLAEARGPHRTGTYEELWVADKLPETRTVDPNDKTHLMIRIWYPTTFTGTPAQAPYAINPGLYLDTTAHWLRPVKDLPTQSVLDAPLAATPARLPILIYNQGGGHPNFSATFQTEFLASHGYLVVAIGHTGWDGARNPYPDGYLFKRDAPRPELSKAERDKMSQLETIQWMWRDPEGQMDSKRHTDNISYVIDRLAEFDRTPGHRFHQRLDLTRIGALGWSIGGATSLQAAAADRRVRAAINLDGWMYGRPVESSGVPVPTMIISTSMFDPLHGPSTPVNPTGKAMGGWVSSTFWNMLGKTDSVWYLVELKNAHHGHVSDLTLFSKYDPAWIHPRVAHEIANVYSLEFFDRHLRGREDTPFLSGKKSYRDAVLTVKPKPAPASP